MNKYVRNVIAILALSTLVLSGCGTAQKTGSEGAKAVYPTKPIELIIAFTAGGSSDVQARIVEKYWKQQFNNQPLTFNYQVGAGGQVGFTAITKAKTDGYTIGGINFPHINLQALSPQATFKTEDFAYIAQLVKDPNLLTVKADSPIKNLQDFVNEAKKKNGKMTVGTVGTFTAHHIAVLQLMEKLGIQLTIVPFTGDADQSVALLGGHVDAMIGNLNVIMRDINKYRLIGIATEKRHPWLKDVPTFKEQGVEFYSYISRGIAGPKNIDPAALKILRDGFAKIANNPDYLKEMEKIGQPADFLTGEQFEKVVMDYNNEAKPLIEKYGLNKK
ncbi:MAG: tripartite tricarboxylate transporter substrate binding protein [Desulfitobacterium hafniense]|nr:tripartite tricarboxylate transporter substrate binding protein [Desulfitobacterium hafniense]